MNEQETDTQRATRSALGGFERDAKTFQGHLDKVLLSAEAFVKRHAKFALQHPGHLRLAETERLLREAKRISGQGVDAVISGPDAPSIAIDVADDASERVAGIEGAVMMLARLALADDGLGTDDADDARSYLRNWLGHLAPLPKREPELPRVVLESTELVTPVPFTPPAPGYVPVPGATGTLADWNENVRSGPVTPAPDPAAGLIQREQERVQAVLDAAAAKAAANPLAAALGGIQVQVDPAALAPPAIPVDPFAAFRAAAQP